MSLHSHQHTAQTQARVPSTVRAILSTYLHPAAGRALGRLPACAPGGVALPSALPQEALLCFKIPTSFTSIHSLSPSRPAPARCPHPDPTLCLPDRSVDAPSGFRNLQNLNTPRSLTCPYLLWQLYPQTTPANYFSMTSPV